MILNVVLIILVGILYYFHFKSAHNSDGFPATAGSSDIVFVNSDTLLENYEYIKDARKDLEAEQAKAENDFQQKGKKLQADIDEYQKNATKLTADQCAATEKVLQQQQQDLMQYKDALSQSLAEKEAAVNEKLFAAIRTYMKKLQGPKPYAFVLGYAKGGGILYANDSLDITKRVLEGLNKEYKEKGK